MVVLLALALCAQADASELEGEFRRWVVDYTHPDTPEADRPALLTRIREWGPSAVVRVQEMADTARPDRVGPLRHLAAELKGGLLDKAEDEEGRLALERLEAVTVTVRLKGDSPETFLHLLRLQCTESLIVDPAEQEALGRTRLTAAVEGRSLLETLDRVLAPAGLDFHTRRGVVTIARRARLWPRPGPATPLSEAQAKELEAALSRLDSESISERESAERAIQSLGSAALAGISAAARGSQGELRVRLVALARRILAPEETVPLHAAGRARGQKLDEDDSTYLGVLRTKKISYSGRDVPLEDAIRKLNKEYDTRLELDPAAASAFGQFRLSFAFQRTGGLDLIESLVLPLGLDVGVEKGKLRIVRR